MQTQEGSGPLTAPRPGKEGPEGPSETSTLSERKQRQVAERIVDFWLAPLPPQSTFSIRANAEHRRLVITDDDACECGHCDWITWWMDDVSHIPVGTIDPRDESQGGRGWT